MPTMKRLIPALLLSLASQPAFSAFTSGDKLNTWSDSWVRITENGAPTQQDGPNSLLYLSYVNGVMDSFDGAVCVPANITLNQSASIARKYIKAHPESWNVSGAALVLMSIQEAFPCPKAKSKPQS